MSAVEAEPMDTTPAAEITTQKQGKLWVSIWKCLPQISS